MTVLALRQSLRMIDWSAPWPRQLRMLALVWLTLIALFARDAADMAAIWWNASTYTHCLFILPLAGWLIWQRADELKPMQPQGWFWGLLPVAAGALGWLLGEAAGVALFRHAGLVLMLQGSVGALLGPQVTRAILFPLFYLAFLVPFGEEAVPMLQMITAHLCMLFLGWTGIPAHMEGVFITTPFGLFEVAEACSGVKFLVAMTAYAALAAHVCFVSWRKRIAFFAAAVITSVLANGFRAFSTIWLSQYWGTEFAASIDHIIYSWFFFGSVMLVVMAVGWRFFDRKLDMPWVSDATKAMAQPVRSRLAALVSIAVLAVALSAQGWLAVAGAMGRSTMPGLVTVPEVPGWSRVDANQAFPWVPRFDGADHRVTAHFRNAKGQQVDLVIAVYAWQEEGRELVGFGQGALDTESEWSWTRAAEAPNGGKGDLIFAPGAEREVASYYVLGDLVTGSATRVKLETLKARLTGGDQAATAILISAEDRPGHDAQAAIAAFASELGAVGPLAAQLVAQARKD